MEKEGVIKSLISKFNESNISIKALYILIIIIGVLIVFRFVYLVNNVINNPESAKDAIQNFINEISKDNENKTSEPISDVPVTPLVNKTNNQNITRQPGESGGSGGGGSSGGGSSSDSGSWTSTISCIDSDHDSYNQSSTGCGVADCNDNNSSINPGATELCNLIDDNCNGEIDTDYIPITITCGTGACQRSSVKNCVSGSLVDSCTPGSPTTEVCNDNIDNDCDGLLDCADNDCSSDSNCQTPENLVEMFNRVSRRAIGIWNATYFENSVSYIWQPETLMYNDVQTGHEVWRMSSTNNVTNFYHNDIEVSPWSADGKRMAFVTFSLRTNAGYSGNLWRVVHTDGTYLRPTVESADYGYSSINDYFHWSTQIPDIYYEVGYRNGASLNQLYKTTVNDTRVARTLIIAYPENIGIDKMISPDGRKILMGSYSEAMVYPTTIYPNAAIDDSNGYSVDRNLALYGTTPNPYSTVHGRSSYGDGSFYYVMPIGGANRAIWRLKSIGSASDGGAYCDNSDFPVGPEDLPYDFGECWPEMADSGTNPDPFGCDYWSHFVSDQWGRYALFSSVDGAYRDPLGPGPGVWNIQNHSYSVLTFGGGAQHHDWQGFTDWTVSSRGTGGEPNYLNDRIYSQKYNNVNSQFTVCYTHTQYFGGTSTYPSGPRPGQSPDGTKVAWHSEFLNSANHPDVFWSVVYYPYPPTNLDATYSSGVRVSFLPPKYTERGWPFANETKNRERNGAWPELDSNGREIGELLYAREIKKYHVWRASSQSGPWSEVGEVNYLQNYTYHSTEDPNNELFMLHPVDSTGRKINPTNKMFFTDFVTSGTYYYALTSEEHSGLESDELSEILRVDVSGGIITNQQIVQTKGQKNFWTTDPQPVLNFNYSATGVVGHYNLSWTEPVDSKIRYYNIYYSNISNPVSDQRYRIASIPVGWNHYLDWLADSDSQGYYGITSVGRHGNEGDIVYHDEFGTLGVTSEFEEQGLIEKAFVALANFVTDVVDAVVDFFIPEKKQEKNENDTVIINPPDEEKEIKPDIPIDDKTYIINETKNQNNNIICIDNDKDGFNLTKQGCGLADCNDNNSLINPNAIENCNNSIDDNCNGKIDCFDNNCINNIGCIVNVTQNQTKGNEIPSDYISYWKFENNLNDEKGINNGVLYGNPLYINGILGNAVEFNGTNYIQLTRENYDFSKGFSFSTWIKAKEFSSNRYILSGRGTGVWFSMVIQNRTSDIPAKPYNFRGYFEGGNFSKITQSSYSANFDYYNIWTHLVFVRNNSNQMIFINGKLEGNDNVSKIEGLSGGLDKIGTNFNGAIDEVMFYNRGLTSEEVRGIYCKQGGSC